MADREHYVGQRLSLKGQLCTIQYIGSVAERPGEWLGVEWDDAARGKHDGTHSGKTYFACRSKSPTCASFIRPAQQWDQPRTFLQALREKYMPDFREADAARVYFSGKEAEEIGFDKFHQRQAQLRGIHVLVLDNMRMNHPLPRPHDEADEISALCADIAELDLSGNLFETLDEIVDLCARLPKLQVLTLDANRFCVDVQTTYSPLPNVYSLGLSRTMFDPLEIRRILSASNHPIFPSLRAVTLAGNEYSGPIELGLQRSISTLDISDNAFASLSDLQHLGEGRIVPETIVLKRNQICTVTPDIQSSFLLSVRELDLSYNCITNLAFFNGITAERFPELRNLRVTGNPLYRSLISADGKPLTAQDGYMLTIARLPHMEYLNYSKISEKERLNAETYYLNQIGVELSRAPESEATTVLKKHPRYRDLCEEYGEPAIQRKLENGEVDPNSLAARLVRVSFHLAPAMRSDMHEQTWLEEIPKSFPIYAILGMVGKRIRQMPLNIRLVLETNEQDPVNLETSYTGPEWWDSSDDEAEQDGQREWKKREVELVAGTRPLGTFVEGNEANVRVELKGGNRDV